MTAPDGVLEENLSRLFARAYAPVAAPPPFRARLRLELERRLAAPARPRTSPVLRIAAGAALAIGAGLVGWTLVHRTAASAASLLASGRAAVREGVASAWRPLTDEEARSGVRLRTDALDLATPAGVAAAVRLGSADRLDLRPDSAIAVSGDPSADLSVALDRGSLELERAQPGPAWRLATQDGAVLLASGSVEVARLELQDSPATRALLRSGSGEVDAEPRAALVPGQPVWMRAGVVLAGPALDTAAGAPPERSGADAPPPEETADAPSAVSLRGTVAAAPGETAPESFTVTLLRRERLPLVALPRSKEFRGNRFAIEGVRPGTYTVFVRAAGFAVWQRAGVEIAEGGPPGELAVEPAVAPAVELAVVLERGASVRGRVVDADGRPVEGATVLSETDTPAQLLPFRLEDPREGWIAGSASLSDGTFELAHLSRGRQRLRATCPGHGAAWSEPIDLAAGEPADLVLHLVRPGSIEGLVARDDGTAWPGALVIASWIDMSATLFDRACIHFGSSTADLRGRYLIEDLPPGLYVVLNVMEGREPGAGAVPRVQQVRVESGVRARIDLPGGTRGTAVAGTILSSTGEPLADRDVTFVPAEREGADWRSTRSRDDGRFDFPSLAPGHWLVYAAGNLGTELALVDEVDVPVAPVFRPVVRAGPGVLRGRVTDAGSGEGLASSVLVLHVETSRGESFAGRTVCDAQGRYALPLLPAGKYRATAYSVAARLGQETAAGIAITADPAGTTRDFALHPGAAMSVLVRDGDGRPLPEASVQFLDAEGVAVTFSPEDRTDPTGRILVRGAKPGRWTLHVEHAGHESVDAAFELAVGDERTVEIRLHPVH